MRKLQPSELLGRQYEILKILISLNQRIMKLDVARESRATLSGSFDALRRREAGLTWAWLF